MRLLLRCVAILLVTATGIGFAQTDEAARQKDIYTIYSLLVSTSLPTVANTTNTGQAYAIASETEPLRLVSKQPPPQDDALYNYLTTFMARCNAPPPGYESKWEEVLADFRARTDAPAHLDRELNLARPYILLNADEVTAFEASRKKISLQSSGDPKSQGAVSVIFLSNVYFNNDRTLAVTSSYSWYGTLGGQGGRKIYEKTAAGGWREVTSGIRCNVNA